MDKHTNRHVTEEEIKMSKIYEMMLDLTSIGEMQINAWMYKRLNGHIVFHFMVMP